MDVQISRLPMTTSGICRRFIWANSSILTLWQLWQVRSPRVNLSLAVLRQLGLEGVLPPPAPTNHKVFVTLASGRRSGCFVRFLQISFDFTNPRQNTLLACLTANLTENNFGWIKKTQAGVNLDLRSRRPKLLKKRPRHGPYLAEGPDSGLQKAEFYWRSAFYKIHLIAWILDKSLSPLVSLQISTENNCAWFTRAALPITVEIWLLHLSLCKSSSPKKFKPVRHETVAVS